MSNFFIRRPIVAMVIAILTVIVGAVTIASLPVAQFPNIVPPEIRLQATTLVPTRRPWSKPSPRRSSSKSTAWTTWTTCIP